MSYYHYKRNITIAELPMDEKRNLDNHYVQMFEDGKNFIRDGNFEKAIELYNKILGDKPRVAAVWCNKAAAYSYMGKELKNADIVRNEHRYREYFRMALEDINQALDLNNKDAVFWFIKGDLMVELEDFEKAESCFEHAVKLNKELAPAWDGRARATYYLSGVYGKEGLAKALKYADYAIKCDENYAEAWFTKGQILSVLDKMRESVKCIRKAVKLAKEQGIKTVIQAGTFFLQRFGYSVD